LVTVRRVVHAETTGVGGVRQAALRRAASTAVVRLVV
jgi:hypothetical protein